MDLLKAYADWASQLERALKVGVTNPARLDATAVRGIAFLGMGGSGIVGDILGKYLENAIDVPAITVKGYLVPKYVGRGWLAVAISYSGNTAETVAAFGEVVKRGTAVAAAASGGRLVELAERLGAPYVQVERGYLPRAALPSLLVGVSKILEELLGVAIDVGGCAGVLRESEAFNVAERLAHFVLGGIPVFVVPDRLYPLGLRAKNEFNENSKVVSKVEVLPELGHNDIVGWEGSPRDLFKFVVLRDLPDPLVDFALGYARELGYPATVLDVGRSGYLGTVLYGSWVVGMASVILAKLRGVDPARTSSISRYRELAEKYLGS